MLARRRLTRVEQVVEFPGELGPVRVDDDGTELTTLGRAGLRVRVTVAGTTVDVVTCHLKSKLLSFPGGRFTPRDEGERARYAVYALHRRAAEAAAVRSYVTTTQLLHGPPGSEIGSGGFDRPDKGDGQRLWNLAPLIPAEDRFTRVYRGRRELIDHLLVSRALVDAVDEVGTVDIGTTSTGDDPRRRRDEPVSDHRPVVATFRPSA